MLGESMGNVMSRSWLQNRLVDLGFFSIALMLFVPFGVFHFVDGHDVSWPVLFGFMIPEFLLVGLIGVIGFFHHKKNRWHYNNPLIMLIFWFFLSFSLFFVVYAIHVIFVPTLMDCVLSLIWNLNTCQAVDIEVTFLGRLYLYVFLPTSFILLIVVCLLLEISNRPLLNQHK